MKEKRMQLIHGITDSLRSDLDACAAHSPEYGNGLGDHLPMLLHAMHALGASPARRAEYAPRYAQRLELRQIAALPATSWRELRGNIDAFDTLEQQFSARIVVEGRDAVLRDLLPALMPGVGASAFHGVIRCGHAIAAQHDGELARGLAYWAAAWLKLLPYDEADALPEPTLDLATWLAHAHDLVTTVDSEQPRIVLRMKAWAAAPQFEALAVALRTDNSTLDTVARFAATLYAQTGNFTVMHMVTSVHALLVLRPWLEDPALAARWFGVSLFGALRAARLTSEQIADALHAIGDSKSTDGMSLRPWEELAAEAIASDDDHAAKIVYSARALFEMFGDKVFHAAAMRGVQVQAKPG